jgi:hypothetical protein
MAIASKITDKSITEKIHQEAKTMDENQQKALVRKHVRTVI